MFSRSPSVNLYVAFLGLVPLSAHRQGKLRQPHLLLFLLLLLLFALLFLLTLGTARRDEAGDNALVREHAHGSVQTTILCIVTVIGPHSLCPTSSRVKPVSIVHDPGAFCQGFVPTYTAPGHPSPVRDRPAGRPRQEVYEPGPFNLSCYVL